MKARLRILFAALLLAAPPAFSAVGDPCMLLIGITPQAGNAGSARPGSGSYRVGETVTLEATANPGYDFLWWENRFRTGNGSVSMSAGCISVLQKGWTLSERQ